MKTKRSISRKTKKLPLSPRPLGKLIYQSDFYKWTQLQAALLRQGKTENLDLENLIEEIESLGRSDKRALKSYLIVLLMHLLKCEFQPSKRTTSWKRSIDNSRQEIHLILDDSPSLRTEIKKLIPVAYEYAKERASTETGISREKFPDICPWKQEDLL